MPAHCVLLHHVPVRCVEELGAYCAVGEPLNHPRDTQLANTCNGETLTSWCTKFTFTYVAQCCGISKQYIQNHLMAQCTQIGGRSSQELWSCRARAAGCYVFCRLACLGPICVIRPSPPAAAKPRAAKIWGKSAKNLGNFVKCGGWGIWVALGWTCQWSRLNFWNCNWPAWGICSTSKRNTILWNT